MLNRSLRWAKYLLFSGLGRFFVAWLPLSRGSLLLYDPWANSFNYFFQDSGSKLDMPRMGVGVISHINQKIIHPKIIALRHDPAGRRWSTFPPIIALDKGISVMHRTDGDASAVLIICSTLVDTYR
jgi:hypothetical protein